jgi:hypothetical protein
MMMESKKTRRQRSWPKDIERLGIHNSDNPTDTPPLGAHAVYRGPGAVKGGLQRGAARRDRTGYDPKSASR